MVQRVRRRCGRCQAILATDNTDRLCTPCRTDASASILHPPTLPPGFWQADSMHEALASWHMGKVIRAYRTHQAHGRTLSQDLLAGWLNLTQAQLSRIEAGRPPQDLNKLIHWARVLQIPPNLLWFKLPAKTTSRGPSTARATDQAKVPRSGTGLSWPDGDEAADLPSRRTAGALSAGPEIADRINYALRNPASADYMTAAHLRTEVQRLDEKYVWVPSTALLARTGQCLSQAAFLVGHARSGRVRRELYVVEAEAAVLMGQLVWDATQRRDHSSARGYFDQAISAARRCHERSIESLALLRASMLALYGEDDPRAGLACAVQSSSAARPVSRVLEGLAHLHAAEAHAMLHDVGACERALMDAEAAFSAIDETDPAIDQYSTALFGRMAGSSYLRLDQPERAAKLLSESAARSRDPSKSRAVVLGNLALASVRQGNVDEATTYLHQGIDVIEQNRGGGGLNVAFTVGRELRRWRDSPVVQDAYDRLLSLTAAR